MADPKPDDDYLHVEDGTWIVPPMKGHANACCDCGLVHVIDYRVVDGRVEFRLRRDVKATAALRRATTRAKSRKKKGKAKR